MSSLWRKKLPIVGVGLRIHLIQKNSTHDCLETVCHSVPQLGVVTKVVAVCVEHVFLQAKFLGQDGQVVVLNQGRSVSCEAALLKVWEHVVKVNRGDELDHCVAKKLKTLVVPDLG